ncbi:EVE domain-containing protein [Dyella sp. KRB-257]|uniref:EVE domain-containing protein n=1 Tax=Dyella sp. KRB-257 TaxID=3400915 RepID=UPI003C0136E6
MSAARSKPARIRSAPVKHWLMKSEPDTFSIDDLRTRGIEPWDGVRNYQARNFMRDGMRVGDGVFFYHSNCAEPGIVGLAKVASEAYPDPSQFDPKSDYFDPGASRGNPRWMLVDVAFVRKLKRTITLKELQALPALADMPLVRKGNRLSVMPVTAAEWKTILDLE